MKKNYQLLSLLIGFLVLLGCSKDVDIVVPDPEPDPMETESSILNLVYPIENDVVEYCCIEFEWESDPQSMDYVFVLSADMAFDSIIIDSIGLSNSLSLDLNLSTNTQYYWKVSSESLDLEETAEFGVIDYVDKKSGVYSAQFHEKVWNIFEGTTLDTIYFEDVVISKSSKEGHISFDYGSQFDYRLNETPKGENGTLSFWDDVEEHPRFSRGGNISLKLDSLRFVSSTDANGGGHLLTISAKLD